MRKEKINPYGTQIKLTDAQILEHIKQDKLEPVILSCLPIVFYVLNKLHVVYNTEALLSAGVEALVKATNSYDINRKPLIPFRSWIYYQITEAILSEMPLVNSILTFGSHKAHSAHIMQQNPIEIDYLYPNTLNIEDPICRDPCKELIKKEENEQKLGIKDKLMSVFQKIEIDSVVMPYSEFSKLYPNISVKQHDNLRTRSASKFRRYIHKGELINKALSIQDTPKFKESIKPKHKICHKCKRDRLAKYYYSKSPTKDGLSYKCRDCLQEETKLRTHTKEYRRRARVYYSNNSLHIRDYTKEYRKRKKKEKLNLTKKINKKGGVNEI